MSAVIVNIDFVRTIASPTEFIILMSEITGDPFNMNGSQRWDLFTNRRFFSQ